MKLPTETSNLKEEQPVALVENGGAAGEAGAAPEQAPAASSGSTESSSTQSSQSAAPDQDFSEYLWMENEEEFDTQVLRELEDEEMINYYYELYEASLNENGTWGPNTASIRVTGPPPPYYPGTGSQEDDSIEALTQGMNSRLTLNSRLNPDAAEFVPGRTPNMSSPN